ncbi:hypothetical protein DMENIID0001_151920 [Sergentomyia squamirostris]
MKRTSKISVEDVNKHKKEISMLSLYYKHLYPIGNIFKWLSHNVFGDSDKFSKREIALVKKDVQDNKIYRRNISFKSLDIFRKYLNHELPHTIEAGAVMNLRPNNVPTKGRFPVEKELVFDIDVSDYDEVRTCCSGKDICRKCWKFMVVACRILKECLHEDFGYENMLWVFSGRRGLHCWVCDKEVRELSEEIRKALVDYFTLPLRLVKRNDTLNINWSHPIIQRALIIIEPFFDEICLQDQEIFSEWKNIEKYLIAEIPDEINKENLREIIRNVQDCGSCVVWSAFCAFVDSLDVELQKDIDLIGSIQIYMLYPRLDVNVTKGVSHLLKTPFSIHPDTLKVAIPFDPDKINHFNTETVPTLPILCREIEDCVSKGVPVNKVSLLLPFLTIFQNFLAKLE